jgi:hypothetical protein
MEQSGSFLSRSDSVSLAQRFQRWGHDPKTVSPEGTADLNAECKVKSAEFHPSLRDLGLSASIPSLEKAGLFSLVPSGHQAASFRKALPPARIFHPHLINTGLPARWSDNSQKHKKAKALNNQNNTL